MKKCGRCQCWKELNSFSRNRAKPDGKQDYCKTCYKELNAARYASSPTRRCAIASRNKKRIDRHRQIIIRHKRMVGCQICGEKEPACLDYHHTDPSQKEANIGVILTHAWRTIKEEIRKCIVLCSNCHRKHHAGVKGYELS